MARSQGRGERELPEAPPQNDAYTGLLVISLLATLTGLIFVAIDWSDYPSAKAPKPTPPASISQPAEAQAGGGTGAAPPPPVEAPEPARKKGA